MVSQEMMDTDQCIQRLIRSEPEGSDHAQHKIEDTAQYWVMKEKEAATNYCHTLELSKSVFLLLYSIFLFGVKILDVALYVSRRGMYACVRRWAIYVRPHGV